MITIILSIIMISMFFGGAIIGEAAKNSKIYVI